MRNPPNGKISAVLSLGYDCPNYEIIAKAITTNCVIVPENIANIVPCHHHHHHRHHHHHHLQKPNLWNKGGGLDGNHGVQSSHLNMVVIVFITSKMIRSCCWMSWIIHVPKCSVVHFYMNRPFCHHCCLYILTHWRVSLCMHPRMAYLKVTSKTMTFCPKQCIDDGVKEILTDLGRPCICCPQEKGFPGSKHVRESMQLW